MKRVLVLVLALAGCAGPPPPDAKGKEIGGSVYKLCDAGRAVYYIPWKGVAVIPNAPECKK